MSLNHIQRFLKHGSLPQLVVFEACARLGSFTRAAVELHMAQPTVSVQIRKLGETMGTPLFEQVGKKMHLTQTGESLLVACTDIFAAIGRMEESLVQLNGLQQGVLRIVTCPAARAFILGVMAEFSVLYPGIQVVLATANSSGMVARMADNEDDLYLFSSPPQSVDLVRQHILDNPLCAFAPAGWAVCRAGRIPLARLVSEPLLMREAGSATAQTVERLFMMHGLKARARMIIDNDEEMRAAVNAGLGVAILPLHDFSGKERAGLQRLDVEGLPLLARWCLAYPVGKRPMAAASAFMGLVRRAGAEFVHTQPDTRVLLPA